MTILIFAPEADLAAARDAVVDAEAVAAVAAVAEGDGAFLLDPVVGGHDGAVDPRNVPLGKVAGGHRQFARRPQPAARCRRRDAHRTEGRRLHFIGHQANQRTLDSLGSGEIEPYIAVLKTNGDITKVAGVQQAIGRAAAASPNSRVSSYFTTRDDSYVSRDHTLMFAAIYPAGRSTFDFISPDPVRDALTRNAPPGVTTNLTGIVPLFSDISTGDTGGPSVLAETIIGVAGLGFTLLLSLAI